MTDWWKESLDTLWERYVDVHTSFEGDKDPSIWEKSLSKLALAELGTLTGLMPWEEVTQALKTELEVPVQTGSVDILAFWANLIAGEIGRGYEGNEAELSPILATIGQAMLERLEAKGDEGITGTMLKAELLISGAVISMEDRQRIEGEVVGSLMVEIARLETQIEEGSSGEKDIGFLLNTERILRELGLGSEVGKRIESLIGKFDPKSEYTLVTSQLYRWAKDSGVDWEVIGVLVDKVGEVVLEDIDPRAKDDLLTILVDWQVMSGEDQRAEESLLAMSDLWKRLDAAKPLIRKVVAGHDWGKVGQIGEKLNLVNLDRHHTWEYSILNQGISLAGEGDFFILEQPEMLRHMQSGLADTRLVELVKVMGGCQGDKLREVVEARIDACLENEVNTLLTLVAVQALLYIRSQE